MKWMINFVSWRNPRYVRGAQESADDPDHLLLSMALKHFAGYESEANRFASNFAFSNFDMLDTFLVPYVWLSRNLVPFLALCVRGM